MSGSERKIKSEVVGLRIGRVSVRVHVRVRVRVRVTVTVRVSARIRVRVRVGLGLGLGLGWERCKPVHSLILHSFQLEVQCQEHVVF